MNIDEWTSTLQFHSHSRGSRDEAIFHGQGGGEDDQKQELLQFFRRLNDALTTYLAERSEPLVFAGVEYLFPIFQEACSYRPLIDSPLTGNPDRLSAEQLHQEAWKLVAPYYRQELEQAIEEFGNIRATDSGTTDLQHVITAATAGAVDMLLIMANESKWGEIDVDGTIRCHDTHREDSVDLVDEAAFLTLKSGGRVWVVDREDFPPDADAVVAVLRYPLPVG